jgi:hypothetical protein
LRSQASASTTTTAGVSFARDHIQIDIDQTRPICSPDDDEYEFIAFARVFTGTLHVGDTVYVRAEHSNAVVEVVIGMYRGHACMSALRFALPVHVP